MWVVIAFQEGMLETSPFFGEHAKKDGATAKSLLRNGEADIRDRDHFQGRIGKKV